MANIYQITNDINGKIYIGKTELSVEKRFREHCKASQREAEKHRPLYAAMRKYGIEHFHVELIEETDNPNEREIYWIEEKGSFKHGYNATIGGDGRSYIDYDQVVALYYELQNCIEVAKIMKINVETVRKILHNRKIPIKSSGTIAKDRSKKTVAMCEKNGKTIIAVFPTYSAAARYLQQEGITTASSVDGIAVHISQVCRGERTYAYGFYWKLIQENKTTNG